MPKQEQEQQHRESIQSIADKAAERAVERMALALGIDTHNPIQTQIEFQALRKLARLMDDEGVVEDLAFVRRLRTASDSIRETTWKTIAKVVVTGLLGLIAVGTKDWWLQHILGLGK